MAELAKDLHIGKKFSLHDELAERERAKRQAYYEKRKKQKRGETADGDGDNADGSASGEQSASGTPAPGGTSATNPAASSRPAAAAAIDEPPLVDSSVGAVGEQYIMIDGEIRLNERSLQVDRHAAVDQANYEVQEENDFTHLTTSATYLRRNMKPGQWSDEETDKFYSALTMFGTDFETIARLFKDKTRKHIKLKFNREERADPDRIQKALVGERTVMIDIEQYQRDTGQEFETAEKIYEEQRKAEEEFEARQKAIEDAKAEEERKKAELLFGKDGQGGVAGGKKRRGKKARPEPTW